MGDKIMYGYIYMTTNLVNDRKYIGMHQSDVFTENYKGSGKLIKQAFDKYGFDNFDVKLIDTANSLAELSEKEAYWIDFYNATESAEFYNIKQGGFGGFKINGVSIKKGRKISEQARINTSNAHKGLKWSQETKDKRSANMIGDKNPFYGKTFSKETIEKLTKIRRNKIWVNNGIYETTINKEELNSYTKDGFIRGRLFAHGRHK